MGNKPAAASRILGTGHHLPPKVVTNADVTKMMETTEEFIVTRTGVRLRLRDPLPAAALRGLLRDARC